MKLGSFRTIAAIALTHALSLPYVPELSSDCDHKS